MEELKEKYEDLEGPHRVWSTSKDLERRLLAFKGVGPVALNIFLREFRGIWQNALKNGALIVTLLDCRI